MAVHLERMQSDGGDGDDLPWLVWEIPQIYVERNILPIPDREE